MSKSPNSTPESRWQFTAAYRLGQHWQQAGDYVRAQVAYSEALELAPRHRASRLNLVVTQIRLGAYRAALSNLDQLCKLETLPLNPRSREPLKPHALVVAYNRALVLRYLGEFGEARKWSKRVAAAAYRRDDDDLVSRLALTALMLHAGILLDVHKGDDALLARAAKCALHKTEAVEPHRLIGDAASIEWHVRRHLDDERRPDARTRYNLACYLARLAELVPKRADELADRAVDEAQVAFTDPRLVPWATRDPALEAMQGRRAWQELLERQAPAPPSAFASKAAAAGSDEARQRDAVDAPVQAPRTSERKHALDDAFALLTDVHVDAEERRARRTRDPLQRLEDLKGQTAALDERAFQLSLFGAVAELRDPVTAYVAPPSIRDRVAVLPLRLADGVDRNGVGRIFVAASEPWIAEAGLRAGVEVTHWDGMPIEHAIENRSALVAAADIEGRRARAIATLTHRATGVFAPLDADEIKVRYGADPEREISLEWEHRHALQAHASDGLQSVDPLVAATARAGSPGARIAFSEFESPGGVRFGHLRIPTFEVADADAFVAAVAARLKHVPPSGLVLDVRSNGGGSIAAAERLLQLFTASPIAPQPVQLRATRLTAQIAHAVPCFRRWSRSIDRAIRRKAPFSDALPLTADHEKACNSTGRVYKGSVVLLIDAMSAGATDIFTAGFVDHGLGRVLATAAHRGMAGGVAWRTDTPDGVLPRPLHRLPDGAAFQLSVARTLRVAKPHDGPLAEDPVVLDTIRRLPAAEVADRDAGLLKHAAEMLKSPQTIRLKPSR
jgi:C-terminal processing protease CtpA/Prc